MGLWGAILLRPTLQRFAVAPSPVVPEDAWIWQDGTTHTWQDDTTAEWQTGVPFPDSTGMSGEDGTPDTWEDDDWMEWEPDTVPDAFSFTDIADADTDTYYTSDPITVAGIDGTYTSDLGDIPLGVSMSVTNAEYRINGGEWTAVVTDDVHLGDVIQLRVMSSGSNNTAVVATLTISGVSADFTVTTAVAAVDITPDAFSFTDVTDQALNTLIDSGDITVSGIDAPAPFEVVGGWYSKNGGAFQQGITVPGTGPALYVNNGDTIELRVLTPNSNSASASSTLNINGVSDTFTATTIAAGAPDTTPDPFSFTDLTSVALSTEYESNVITVLGIDSPANLTLTGTGEYSINGGTRASGATTVNLGDQIRLYQTSSGSNSTGTSLTLDIGGVSDTWTITTLAPAGSTTTLLTQPVFIDVVEDYAYPNKIGLAYFIANYQTQFLADTGGGSVLTATNTSELNTHIATAKSNTAISAINLNSGNYTWTQSSLTGLNRPASNPLVIRTTPGQPTQAIMSQIKEESGNINGVAFVDLDVSNGLIIQGNFTGTTSVNDVLVERCTGWVVIQGCQFPQSTGLRVPGPAATNIIVRLNVLRDHWLLSQNALTHGGFFWNVDGLLLEGNVIDHNGWDPAYDRSRSASLGGPTLRSHNIYISRPSSNVVCRYNWVSRGSSHGFHTKGGGNVYRNLFSRNPIAAEVAHGGSGLYNAYGLVDDTWYYNNVIIGGDDISPSNLRGMGLWLGCATNMTIEDNLFLYDLTTPTNSGVLVLDQTFPLDGRVQNNIAYSWTPQSINRGIDNYTPNITYSGNTWSASSISSTARDLAYQLGGDKNNYAAGDAWIDGYVSSRVRLGVDIEGIKTWMDDLVAGVTP